MGKVVEALKSQDERVRRVKVLVFKEGKQKTVYRPISQIVLLVPTKEGQKSGGTDNISLGKECNVGINWS